MQTIQSIPFAYLAIGASLLGSAVGWLIVYVLHSRSVSNDDLGPDDWGV